MSTASRRDKSRVPRRVLLGSALAGGALAIGLPRRVFGQTERTVKLTLPWLAQGPTAFAYVADDQGAFRRRGIKVEISRGFGSLAAAQALGSGAFEFGIFYAGAGIVGAATGLPLAMLATVNYDAYMGILLRIDSPIHVPKDLEGKRVGGVAASAEAPFWPAFAKRTSIDLNKVTYLQADARVLERTLVDGQIDGAIGIATSSYAVAKSIGQDTRAMLWSDYGVSFYANGIATRQEILKADPGLCQAMTEALLEGLAFSLRDPNASLDILLRKVPELGMTAGGREFAKLGQGFMLASVIRPETIEHGLGYSDPARVVEMTDLVMEYAVPNTAHRPDPETLYTNRFAGTVKLSTAEWDMARKSVGSYPTLIGARAV